MPLPGWGSADSPFHPGEQAAQEHVGMRERMDQVGRRIVRDFMPDQHREFFEDLPFLVVGSARPEGTLWASLLFGEPGFVSSPTERGLLIRAAPLPGDPLGENLRVGAPLGLLGIELPTRRRNRANGRVSSRSSDSFEVQVEQSFGNCNQYIQARAGIFRRPAAPTHEAAALSAAALSLLSRTDTTFIATSSQAPQRGFSEGVDVSHRGGRPGFVRTVTEASTTRLTMPDFSGNFMFNTFGNLEVNPRAGLLALDFDSGALLSLTGTASVQWEGPEVDAFEGAERLLRFEVSEGLLWADVLQGWSAPQFSPHLRGTGVWTG
ncbi:MAG: flavin-nucleotide-binding protein [Myxococcales bacterium]|nr:MAG: flavin-nucleotide-binding protein [Myxococcales bacterium]